MSLDFEFHTFGCKVNTYDTGLMQKRIGKESFNAKSETQSKVHLVNTCAVTAEATREAVRRIRKLKRDEPNSKVVVTGCSAQVDGKTLDSLAEADLIIANSHKGDLTKIINRFLLGESDQKVFRSNIFKKSELGVGGGLEDSHTRTFLKVQDGCNSFCSFCIIPYTRGKSRSLPVPELIQNVNKLYEEGVREIVITGIHLGDYQDDETPGGPYVLEDLVESFLGETKMPRFRISSLEPLELSDRLLDLYSDDRMCPHFHMSIQSAQDQVLRDMKRIYTAKDVEDRLNLIGSRLKNAFVGMDVIVGFPSETPEFFEETLNRLKASYWTKIHVFPYSERPGTRAAELMEDSVPIPIRKQRSSILRELSLERYNTSALNSVGTTKRCLILKNRNAKHSRAIARDYWTIQLDSHANFAGSEVNVEVTGYDQLARGTGQEGIHYGRLV